MADADLERISSVTDPWIMSPRSEKDNGSVQSKPGENLELKKQTTKQEDKSPPLEKDRNESTQNVNISHSKHENNNTGFNSKPEQLNNLQVSDPKSNASPINTEKNHAVGFKSVEKSQKDSQETVQHTDNAGLKEGEPTREDLNENLEGIYDEYDPEFIITDEEKKAFDAMLSQRKEDLANRKISFEKWSDSITRRRMFALSRRRKLGICQKERIKFYKQMEQFVKDAEDALHTSAGVMNNGNNNNINAAALASSQTPESDDCLSKGQKASSNQGGSQREETGSVVKTEASVDAAKSENLGSLSTTETEKNTKQSPVIVPVKS